MKKALRNLAFSGCLLLAATVAQSAFWEPVNHWMVFNSSYSYDGERALTKANLGGNSTNAIARDAGGNIWIGTTGGGLRMWNGKDLITPQLPRESILHEAEITSIAADSKGGVWVGTSEGLARWDGASWSNIGGETIGMSVIRDLVVTPTDKVYVSGVMGNDDGVTGGGIAFFNGQAWSKWTTETGAAPDTLMQDLILDANNHLWMSLGTHNKGVAKFDGKNWKLFNTSNGLPADDIRAIATNKSGAMFFATSKGLLEYNGSDWKIRPYSNGFGPKLTNELGRRNGVLEPTSLNVEDNGHVWMGLLGGGVYNYRDKYNDRFYDQTNSLLPSNLVMKVLIDNNGAKWFLSGLRRDQWAQDYFRGRRRSRGAYASGTSGIVVLKEYGRVNDPKWTITDGETFDGNTYGFPFNFGEDKDGTMWFSGYKGLVSMKGGDYKVFSYKNELATDLTWMHAASDGKIYASGSTGGIRVYENGKIEQFAKWPNMGGVLTMAIDSKGRFWSGGNGGLSRRDGDEWETYNKRHGNLPGINVYSVFSDSKGRLWVGTGKGAGRFNEADSTFIDVETDFPARDIHCITEDPKGRIWVGTNKGVSILDDTTWTHINRVDSLKLKNFRVEHIGFDKNGVAWLGTYFDGLLRYDGASWKQYTNKSDASFYDHIAAMKVGSDGKVYIKSELTDFNLAGSDVWLGSKGGDVEIEKMIRAKVRTNNPHRLFVVIEP